MVFGPVRRGSERKKLALLEMDATLSELRDQLLKRLNSYLLYKIRLSLIISVQVAFMPCSSMG